MDFPKACCILPPVSSDYKPQGTDVTVGDLKVYETKDKTPKVVLISAYDIFGYNHPQIKQFNDKLSSTGLFRVVMPDFFRGKAIDAANFPPEDVSVIYDLVATAGSWENVVKQDIINVINHYKKEGITTFGIFGFCWGGKMAIRSVCELDSVKGAALIHPTRVTSLDAEEAKAPVLFLPTKDEPDMLPLYETVKKNLGEEKAEHYRFEDMTHGFVGARGDWKDDLQRKRVDEAISLVNSFFQKHLIK